MLVNIQSVFYDKNINDEIYNLIVKNYLSSTRDYPKFVPYGKYGKYIYFSEQEFIIYDSSDNILKFYNNTCYKYVYLMKPELFNYDYIEKKFTSNLHILCKYKTLL